MNGEQLGLAGVAPPKPRPKLGVGMCTCGHELAMHDASGRCTWCPPARAGAGGELVTFNGVKKTRDEWRRELGLVIRACACERFDERVAVRRKKPEAPNFARPRGAIILKRPDTKRYVEMGWALVVPRGVRCYIEAFRPKTPNEERSILGSLWRHPPLKAKGIVAGLENGHKHATERAAWAIESCYIAADVLERGRPERVTLTRVSSGKLDEDGLIGSLKYIRDGVAEALLFDDRIFSIHGRDPEKVALFYEKQNPGKRGAFGILIDVQWPHTER